MRIWLRPFNKVLIIGLINLDRFVVGLQSTSFCSDGKQILMIDLDKMSKEEALAEARRLVKKYDLPHMLVLQSSKSGFHLYSFTPLSYDEILKTVFDSRADSKFKECLLANKKATLRITKKLWKKGNFKLVGEIKNPKSNRKVLEGGKLAFFKLLGLEDREYEV